MRRAGLPYRRVSSAQASFPSVSFLYRREEVSAHLADLIAGCCEPDPALCEEARHIIDAGHDRRPARKAEQAASRIVGAELVAA